MCSRPWVSVLDFYRKPYCNDIFIEKHPKLKKGMVVIVCTYTLDVQYFLKYYTFGKI